MDGMLCSNKFYLIQTQQARRLAASVDSENGPTSDAWHKMNTTVAKAPKSKSAKSSDKESLVKKKARKSNKDESIYDQDAMDEVQGRTNDPFDSDDEDIDDFIEAPLQHDIMIREQDVVDLPAPLGALIMCFQRWYYTIRNTTKRIHGRVYGDSFPWEDFTRTITLSSTLFIMIGGYWLLRSLKDPVLTALCGVESIPKAKMLSVFVVLGVVAVYNHLLSEDSGFRKEQVRSLVLNTLIPTLLVHDKYLPFHNPAILCLWNVLWMSLPRYSLHVKPSNNRPCKPNRRSQSYPRLGVILWY